MKRRVECRFSKWPLKIVCLCSVIVSANNSTKNDQVKTNSYTAAMVSTTTVPTSLGPPGEQGKEVNDQRTIQSMMMAMLDGKEKSWSHKKKGILGTHNLDIKMPAQESFFCKFIKRQSVVMFSFCMQDQGWGWKKKKKKAKKKKAKKKKGGGGWGASKKKKTKKKKGKKKKGGGGWKPTTEAWTEPTTKAWKPPSTTKGWKQEEEEGWGDDAIHDEPNVHKNKKTNDKGERDDDDEVMSQDEDYKPKKDYKGKKSGSNKAGTTKKPPSKTKSTVSVSTKYISEFDLDKWENSDQHDPEDIMHHHFYRSRW